MKTISLLKDWRLRDEELSVGASEYLEILDKKDGWMTVPSLPCDVHTPLVEAGRIKEPLIAGNTFDCEWVENKSFWFMKAFTLKEEDVSKHGVELFIEMLDIHADIFVNGIFVGHHASAMYPFRKNVRSQLKAGENTILIRLTVGLERVRDEDIKEVRDSVSCEWRRRREGRGDDRRCMLRKPQYVFGWDQSPRLATCAIAGDVRLDVLDEVAVRDVRFETLEIKKEGARLLVEAEIESRFLLKPQDVEAIFTLEYEGKTVYTVTQTYVSQPGANFRDFSFTLKNPLLWWPNGYGEQPLYTARVTVKNENGVTDEKSIRVGVRTVELDMSEINEVERHYTFVVNGERIYCRGADFIQSDALYARVTDEHQDKLLTAAKNANFCMLRFWDGNIYQTNAVYDLCDKYGLLVLQNFCFACSAYPDHIEEFRREVEREADYQIKRLRSHPSLALWYGNGENESILEGYLGRDFFNLFDHEEFPGGTYIYNQILPRLCHALCKIGYVSTTPFGFRNKDERGLRGDSHYYPFLNLAPEKQQYRISAKSIDDLTCKFMTEGGIMGPPSIESLIKYCGGRENLTDESPIFLHHKNTFEKNAVRDGIYMHYTGERKLSLEEYCLYGGLFQGSLIGLEADHIRSLENCSGSLLWCFNDGFGEIGFSFMDHYANPKPVYYFLKRAYAPQRIILKKQDNVVKVYCSNASREACEFTLEYGYTDFEGKSVSEFKKISLQAHTSRTVCAEYPIGERSLKDGIFFARADRDDILPATLWGCDFKELKKKATLAVTDVKKNADTTEFTVTTDCFAHAVHFNTPPEVQYSDQYFDLLPGEKRRVIQYANHPITPDCVFIEK